MALSLGNKTPLVRPWLQHYLMIVAGFILLHGITITFTYSTNSQGNGNSLRHHRRRLDYASYKAGFISIDCGTDEAYTEAFSTIYYEPDASFVDTGVNMDISQEYIAANTLRLMNNVRSFPKGTKNCYTLKPAQGKGTMYMVRAYFMYGNYDSLNAPPTFDLHLGVDVWDTVRLDNSSHFVGKEMIHTPSTDYLYVCLANTGHGTPFISALELRPLNDTIYDYKKESGSLDLVIRGHCSPATVLGNVRYPVDKFDRIWVPVFVANGMFVNTTSEVNTTADENELPSSVMKGAVVPFNISEAVVSTIHLSYTNTDPSSGFYMCFHMAELSMLHTGQIREFNVTANGLQFFGPFVPRYLSASAICTSEMNSPQLTVSFHSTKRATLPPILNALEIFTYKKLSQFSTNQIEVDAMMNIKTMYNITKNWQGDPCNPKAYSWDGVGCNYDNSNFSRITSLDLSSSRLTGDITASIANLSALQVLDLSNNKLRGQIPEFLTKLPSLTTLNLTGNSFTGPVPELLLERSREGSLSLSLANNPGLCSSTSCTLKTKKKALIVPIVVPVCAVFVLLLLVYISFSVHTRRKKLKATQSQYQEPGSPGYSKRKGGLMRFTYSEVTNMTGGFQRELGKGGFGIVYYGCLKDGTEVAVKMLSPTINASEEFSAEVGLLMAIRHKNLVSLIGYSEEGTNLGLIYEYMACGDLHTFLLASGSSSWEARLQIAIDAAQGLDYLHNGCRPPIVHRDVKTPNILLNENLQAKIADFGLSKIFPDEFKSYVSTRVIGTPGYLDPEYYVTQMLNDKSDVYSFGVVLLELITGQAAIVKNGEQERTSLVHLVSLMIERGDIWTIVDQRLKQIQSKNSVWRATDIALTCVKPTPVERPTMSQIVSELKECLAMEMKSGNSRMASDDLREMSLMIPSTAMGPAAR